MSVFWWISYAVLWLLVIGGCLTLLALAREIESLHKKVETLEKYLRERGDKNHG
jgi:hypothetical protein